ncbi:MAG TPA: LuxR family transcriptional regulator, partial [Cyanobacteria bacterium UBA12227]|nr:LuxR family transcriptional regulator [Cyanobacteria bacterium UBA12227]
AERGLSNAELEVLSLAMEGKGTSAIAKQIGISEDAVRKRLSEVYQKFEIPGRGPVKLTKLQQMLMSRYQEYQGHKNAETLSTLNELNPKVPHTRHIWGEAPDVSVFYGRGDERVTLKRWIVQERCRLVAVSGMAGIGKTALSVKLAKEIQDEFEWVIWRSLRQVPPIQDFLKILIQLLSPTQEMTIPETVEGRVSWLVNYFRQH